MNNFQIIPPGEMYSHPTNESMHPDSEKEDSEPDDEYDIDSPTNFRTRFSKPPDNLELALNDDNKVDTELLEDDPEPEDEDLPTERISAEGYDNDDEGNELIERGSDEEEDLA